MTNTNDGTTTLNETGDTLVVTDIAEDEFGTYKCTATNSADLSGSVTVTIEEGGTKIVLSNEKVSYHLHICAIFSIQLFQKSA